MTIVPISLASKSAPARYTQGGTASLVNMYVEEVGEDGKVPWYVRACDGLEGFALLSTSGGCRAAIYVSPYLYVVAGVNLYRVSSIGDVVGLGAMSISATGPVYMERNRRSTPDISIVCDGLMYNYRTSLAQVVDADLLAPTSLAFNDGQFIIGTANNKWQVGDIDDGTSWDGLSFERADADPDAVIRVSARQGEAVIFGEKTTEFWSNEGLTDATGYQRAAVGDYGCLAANSIAKAEQTIFFVAHDRTVRALQGYHAQRISNPAVERAIESLTDHTTIQATSWVKDGHTFYKLTAPGYWTWVYDTTTGFWHERRTYGQPDWRVSFVVPAFGDKLIAGDAATGNLYEMSPDYLDEAGNVIACEMILPPVSAYPQRMTINRIYIDAEKGVGTGKGASQDVEPLLMLSYSKDGGATFTGPRTLRLGAQGERKMTIKTDRFGQAGADGFVFKIEVSAAVVKTLYQMKADVELDEAA